MLVNNINGVIKTYEEVPGVFELRKEIIGYYNLQDPSVHYADGFRELVEPTLLENQKKGDVIYDLNNPINTYEVIYLTQDEIDAIAQELIDKPINNEYINYIVRKDDGVKRYLKLAAEFRLLKLSGDITPDFHILLDNKLKPVRDELVNGQFVDALRFLEVIGSADITQPIYDRFHSSLTAGITEHYS